MIKSKFVTTLTLIYLGINLCFSQEIGNEWKDPGVNEINRMKSRASYFYEKSFDDSSWNEIPVPGLWELNGYGVPVYVNWGWALQARIHGVVYPMSNTESHSGIIHLTF